MALYDNKYWLLSHIRNSFLSTDDTGMCELIMCGEERKHLKESLDFYPDVEESEDEDDLSHESYDLQLDLDFGIRHRSNTAIRLEKMEMKKKTSKMKHIKWEMSKAPLDQQYLDELFVRQEPKIDENIGKKSLLSTTFQQYSKLPSNPFIEYSKFDGSGLVNIFTKKYRIFITMLPEQERNYPVYICCIATAKIQELIGLILLKCSTKFENYSWKSVNSYGLYITEEDGEVDRDFPCLDWRECIAKFGFTCLGLVEHDTTKNVNFDQQTETIPLFDSSLEEGISNKKGREQLKIEQEKQISSDLQLIDDHNKAMEAPLYKSYTVHLVNKKISKVETHLGISGEKIEIDPVQQSVVFALGKTKPSSHSMDAVAWAEVSDTKNRTNFKVFYTTEKCSDYPASPIQASTTFKHYEFETDPETAEEIVNKINSILQLRSSESRKEYLAAQERKFYKKKHLSSK